MMGIKPSVPFFFLILIATLSSVACTGGTDLAANARRNADRDHDRNDDDDNNGDNNDRDDEGDCARNADCGTGEYCDIDTRTCVDRGDDPGDEPECSANADCGAGQLCDIDTRTCVDRGNGGNNGDDDEIFDDTGFVGDAEGNLVIVAHRPDDESFRGLPRVCLSFGLIRDLHALRGGDVSELGHWVEESRFCADDVDHLVAEIDTDGVIEAPRWSVSFCNEDGTKCRYGCEGFRETAHSTIETTAFYADRVGDDQDELDTQVYSATWAVRNSRGDLVSDAGCGHAATVDGSDFPEFVRTPIPPSE